MLGVRARSTLGKSHRISRRVAWSAFTAHQIALSTTAFLLWLNRGRVLAANPGGVADVDVAPAGKLLTVVRQKAERLTLVVHVDDERLEGRWGLDFLSIPYGRILLDALSTNMMRYTDPSIDGS